MDAILRTPAWEGKRGCMRAITSTTAAATPALEIGAATFYPGFEAARASGGSTWYRVTPSGVVFYSLEGGRVGGVSRHGVLYASGMVNGRPWHNYADIKTVGPISYGDKCRAADCALEIWRQHFPAGTPLVRGGKA